MQGPRDTSSSKVREKLNHPVIDTDGHMLEFLPALLDYVKQVAGASIAQRVEEAMYQSGRGRWHDRTPEDRRKWRASRPPFWAIAAKNNMDRAAAMLPRLLRERLDSLGIDFGIIYPTTGFILPEILQEKEIRLAACRAQNIMVAEMFAGCEDRLTPAATIPCHTPEEAIAELNHCVTQLSLKVAMITNLVRRPVEALADREPEITSQAVWADVLALDSAYDYDPLWAKCAELKVAVTAHSQSQGFGFRRSHTNYMYNQTGHFADAAHAFAKALFFGGVTARFPNLNFAFLECGVAWGCTLYTDLMERWKKRNGTAIDNYNPAHLDMAFLGEMFERYGTPTFAKYVKGDGIGGRQLIGLKPESSHGEFGDSSPVDEFMAAQIKSVQDLYDRYVPNFYFGCEADDPLTPVAFRKDWFPLKARFNAMLGSDIGHWDVTDMTTVLGEAYELVTDGLISEKDFEDFTFTNAIKLHAGMNPDFFKGTVVEDSVDAVLRNESVKNTV